MHRAVRILIVDDHTLFRESVSRLLAAEPGYAIVGSVSNADAAVEVAVELKPDVVLMDIDMPGLIAFDAADQIARMLQSTRIIFLSGYLSDHHLQQALRVKAKGCLPKTATPAELIEAVREVAQGRDWFPPDIRARMAGGELAGAKAGDQATGVSTLTSRETEVLQYLARGMTKKEIAATMHLSVKTVEGHAQKVMNKLNIHDRVELARYAIREGLVKA